MFGIFIYHIGICGCFKINLTRVSFTPPTQGFD